MGRERAQNQGSRTRARKRVGALLSTAAVTVLLAACGSSSKGPVTLNWYVFPEPSGSFQAAATECSQGSHGAYNIKINFLSTSSDQQRVSLVRRLAANDSAIDILAMDVDWTAEFATAKWLKPVPAGIAAQIKSQDLAGPVQTATWQNRLWAVPINSNTELLWYRKDLVPSPPKTWTQMIQEADQLAARGKPHYIEEQGAQYEGLTVWFNSMVDSAGGQILTANNKVVLNNATEKAAQIMKDLATSKGADPSLNVSQEGPGQVAFQSGTAAFMINYPFVWSATQAGNPKVFKDMGYAYFPQVTAGISPKVSIGGYNLGISAFSKHPNLAFQAVQCLTQDKNQSRDAIKGGLAPVAASIYDQPSFDKAYPFHQLIKQQLQTYGIRPQTPAYADVTLAIQKTLSPTSNINPNTVVSTLRNEIKASLSSSALL
ncbi:MAG TPA: extracellular solute-binding protein [Solirubrobacteraceae bacterium]|nr:extracellular solute-binding protein [Solirubrobacteraceae bacterium]